MTTPFVKRAALQPHSGLCPGERHAVTESGHLVKLLEPIRTQAEVARMIGCSPQLVQKTEVVAIHKLRLRILEAVRREPGLESEVRFLIACLEKRDTRSIFERRLERRIS